MSKICLTFLPEEVFDYYFITNYISAIFLPKIYFLLFLLSQALYPLFQAYPLYPHDHCHYLPLFSFLTHCIDCCIRDLCLYHIEWSSPNKSGVAGSPAPSATSGSCAATTSPSTSRPTTATEARRAAQTRAATPRRAASPASAVPTAPWTTRLLSTLTSSRA